MQRYLQVEAAELKGSRFLLLDVFNVVVGFVEDLVRLLKLCFIVGVSSPLTRGPTLDDSKTDSSYSTDCSFLKETTIY